METSDQFLDVRFETVTLVAGRALFEVDPDLFPFLGGSFTIEQEISPAEGLLAVFLHLVVPPAGFKLVPLALLFRCVFSGTFHDPPVSGYIPQPLLKRLSSPMQPGHDGPQGDVHDFRHLGVRKSFHIG